MKEIRYIMMNLKTFFSSQVIKYNVVDKIKKIDMLDGNMDRRLMFIGTNYVNIQFLTNVSRFITSIQK